MQPLFIAPRLTGAVHALQFGHKSRHRHHNQHCCSWRNSCVLSLTSHLALGVGVCYVCVQLEPCAVRLLAEQACTCAGVLQEGHLHRNAGQPSQLVRVRHAVAGLLSMADLLRIELTSSNVLAAQKQASAQEESVRSTL
jgi:hypothetical protein